MILLSPIAPPKVADEFGYSAVTTETWTALMKIQNMMSRKTFNWSIK